MPPNANLSTRKQSEFRFVVLFFGLCCIAAVAGIRWSCIHIPQHEFNQQAWEKAAGTLGSGKEEDRVRQTMIRDLVTNLLPGKDKSQIEDLLGTSWLREADPLEQDLLYEIGTERVFLFDHRGLAFVSPNLETLVIRLDAHGRFSSWYIDGTDRWPGIVGPAASATYRETK